MDDDEVFYKSYSDVQVHLDMLMDIPRMDAYSQAIAAAQAEIRDSIIIDVGGGTGILSLMAAKYGPKRIYCVEASTISRIAIQTVALNNRTELIKVICHRVEDVTPNLLYELETDEHIRNSFKDNKIYADIIISEWMGFHLLHENMLESVIITRDNLLRGHGTGGKILDYQMMPNTASLSAAIVSVPVTYNSMVNLPNDIEERYGIDFSVLSDYIPAPEGLQIIQLEEGIEAYEGKCTGGENFWIIDICRVTVEEIAKVDSVLSFELDSDSTTDSRTYHGVCIWFEANFHVRGKLTQVLSTRPGIHTHWKQTMIWLPPISIESKTVIDLQITLNPDPENKRHCVIGCEFL